MKNHVWMVLKRGVPIWFEDTREEARKVCDYFNGLSKGKKGAPYKARKYAEVR